MPKKSKYALILTDQQLSFIQIMLMRVEKERATAKDTRLAKELQAKIIKERESADALQAKK